MVTQILLLCYTRQSELTTGTLITLALPIATRVWKYIILTRPDILVVFRGTLSSRNKMSHSRQCLRDRCLRILPAPVHATFVIAVNTVGQTTPNRNPSYTVVVELSNAKVCGTLV